MIIYLSQKVCSKRANLKRRSCNVKEAYEESLSVLIDTTYAHSRIVADKELHDLVWLQYAILLIPSILKTDG